MLFLTVLGIFNAVSFPLAAYMLWTQNGRFSFRDTPLSYARKTHTKTQFVLYFILGTLLEALFIVMLFYNFSSLRTEALYILATVGLAASIGIGITTTPNTKIFHRVMATLFVITMITWSFLFHIQLSLISKLTGMTGLALSCITLVTIPYLYFIRKSVGQTELFFLFIVTFWNILMSTMFL